MNRNERIVDLWKNWKHHPAVRFFNIRLINLDIGRARVLANVPLDWMMNVDMKSADQIVQGGLFLVIADFAGVYAAMSKTNEHTAWIEIESWKFKGPIIAGDTIEATGKFLSNKRRKIRIQCNLYVNNVKKGSGVLVFLVAKGDKIHVANQENESA